MPFKSKSQERFMFANYPDLAKEFAKETKGPLPERMTKTKEKGKGKKKMKVPKGGHHQ